MKLQTGEPLNKKSAASAISTATSAASLCAVIPFYNEREYLPATLLSIIDQKLKPGKLLLIDNASTDNSADLVRTVLSDEAEIDWQVITANKPGKIHALHAANDFISTEYVAFCDADTIYPPHYFATALKLFEKGGPRTSAVMAAGVYSRPDGRRAAIARYKTWVVSKLLARQCHTGGFAQIFRTTSYKSAGGYDAKYWPFVLEDHEIMHRILKVGSSLYHPSLWCAPSTRRTDRSNVSWSLFEQIIYHLTPFRFKDWFFYKFLAKRMEERGFSNQNLRQKTWLADV